MSSKNLVICDQNKEYAARLADYFTRKKELVFQVKMCSTFRQLRMLCQEMEIAVLLVDEKISIQELEFSKQPVVITLCSGVTTESSECKRIFRYQSADDIYGQMITYLAEEGDKVTWNVRKKEGGKIVGFYSPVHRMGQTTFAIRKGKEWSKEKNVLYLNLENYSGVGGIFTGDLKRNMSMLLYYTRQEAGNIGILITTLVKQMDGLDYVPPAVFPEELKSITREEWLWLFEEILNQSIYEILILDLGDGIQGLYDILRRCDEVYLPKTNDQMAAEKMYQYGEILCRQGYGQLWERMIRCDYGGTAKGEGTRWIGPV